MPTKQDIINNLSPDVLVDAASFSSVGDGNAITTDWIDESGNGNDWVIALNGTDDIIYRASSINNLPAIELPEAYSGFISPITQSNTMGWCIAFVHWLPEEPIQYVRTFNDFYTNYNINSLHHNRGRYRNTIYLDPSLHKAKTTSTQLYEPHLYIYNISSTSVEIYDDLGLHVIDVHNVDNSYTWTINKGASPRSMNSLFSTILQWNRELAPNEINDLYNYLADTYGFQKNLVPSYNLSNLSPDAHIIADDPTGSGIKPVDEFNVKTNWKDISGNGNDWVIELNGTDDIIYRENQINGLACIEFPQANSGFYSGLTFANVGGWCLAFVHWVKAESTIGNTRAIQAYNGNANVILGVHRNNITNQQGRRCLYLDNDPKAHRGDSGQGGEGVVVDTELYVPHLYIFNYSNTTDRSVIDCYDDFGQYSSFSHSNNRNYQFSINVGNADDQPMNSFFGEIIQFDRELNQEEIKQLFDYLSVKWGFYQSKSLVSLGDDRKTPAINAPTYDDVSKSLIFTTDTDELEIIDYVQSSSGTILWHGYVDTTQTGIQDIFNDGEISLQVDFDNGLFLANYQTVNITAALTEYAVIGISWDGTDFHLFTDDVDYTSDISGETALTSPSYNKVHSKVGGELYDFKIIDSAISYDQWKQLVNYQLNRKKIFEFDFYDWKKATLDENGYLTAFDSVDGSLTLQSIGADLIYDWFDGRLRTYSWPGEFVVTFPSVVCSGFTFAYTEHINTNINSRSIRIQDSDSNFRIDIKNNDQLFITQRENEIGWNSLDLQGIPIVITLDHKSRGIYSSIYNNSLTYAHTNRFIFNELNLIGQFYTSFNYRGKYIAFSKTFNLEEKQWLLDYVSKIPDVTEEQILAHPNLVDLIDFTKIDSLDIDSNYKITEARGLLGNIVVNSYLGYTAPEYRTFGAYFNGTTDVLYGTMSSLDINDYTIILEYTDHKGITNKGGLFLSQDFDYNSYLWMGPASNNTGVGVEAAAGSGGQNCLIGDEANYVGDKLFLAATRTEDQVTTRLLGNSIDEEQSCSYSDTYSGLTAITLGALPSNGFIGQFEGFANMNIKRVWIFTSALTQEEILRLKEYSDKHQFPLITPTLNTGFLFDENLQYLIQEEGVVQEWMNKNNSSQKLTSDNPPIVVDDKVVFNGVNQYLELDLNESESSYYLLGVKFEGSDNLHIILEHGDDPNTKLVKLADLAEYGALSEVSGGVLSTGSISGNTIFLMSVDLINNLVFLGFIYESGNYTLIEFPTDLVNDSANLTKIYLGGDNVSEFKSQQLSMFYVDNTRKLNYIELRAYTEYLLNRDRKTFFISPNKEYLYVNFSDPFTFTRVGSEVTEFSNFIADTSVEVYNGQLVLKTGDSFTTTASHPKYFTYIFKITLKEDQKTNSFIRIYISAADNLLIGFDSEGDLRYQINTNLIGAQQDIATVFVEEDTIIIACSIGKDKQYISEYNKNVIASDTSDLTNLEIPDIDLELDAQMDYNLHYLLRIPQYIEPYETNHIIQYLESLTPTENEIILQDLSENLIHQFAFNDKSNLTLQGSEVISVRDLVGYSTLEETINPPIWNYGSVLFNDNKQILTATGLPTTVSSITLLLKSRLKYANEQRIVTVRDSNDPSNYLMLMNRVGKYILRLEMPSISVTTKLSKNYDSKEFAYVALGFDAAGWFIQDDFDRLENLEVLSNLENLRLIISENAVHELLGELEMLEIYDKKLSEEEVESVFFKWKQQYNTNKYLVADYNFTDQSYMEINGTDVTKVIDLTGNGYDLTVPSTNTAPLFDIVNKYVSFDGVSNGSALSNTSFKSTFTEMTMIIRCKINDFDNGKALFSYRNKSEDYIALFAGSSNNTVTMFWSDGTNAYDNQNSYSATSTMNSYAIGFESGRVFAKTKDVDMLEELGTFDSVSSDIFSLGVENIPDIVSEGEIDVERVQVYNRALTEDEIQAIMETL